LELQKSKKNKENTSLLLLLLLHCCCCCLNFSLRGVVVGYRDDSEDECISVLFEGNNNVEIWQSESSLHILTGTQVKKEKQQQFNSIFV
jgi:hypothetical protein